jgi:WD40 repeat protein
MSRRAWWVALAGLLAGPSLHAEPAPRLRLVAHLGQRSPVMRVVGGSSDPNSDDHVSIGGRIWTTAVAPGGRFALLHTEAEPWINGLMVLALPEGRILRAVEAPPISLEAQAYALAPDGRWGLFAGEHDDALVWDTERGRRIARLARAHAEPISTVAIAPDGRGAVTASEDGTVVLWDVPARAVRHRFKIEEGKLAAATFSPDGRRVLVAGRDVWVWERNSGRLSLTLHGHGPFNRVAFTPDGGRIVCASSYDHVMTVSDARTGRLLQLREKDPLPVEMAMAADGRSVLGQDGGTIYRWPLADLAAVEELAFYNGVPSGIGVAAGGRLVFTTDEEGDLKLWDARTGKRQPSPQRAITALAWTPDGRHLVAGASDGTLSVWTAAGKRLLESALHGDAIVGVAVATSGRLAGSASTYGPVAMWPLPRGPGRVLDGDRADQLAWVGFSADGATLLVGSNGGEVERLPVAPKGKVLAGCNAQAGTELAVPFDDGRSLLAATASWGTIPDGHGDTDDRADTLFRLDLGDCKVRWSDRGPARTALAVSADGKLALVADRKGALVLHDAATGAQQLALREGREDRGERANLVIAAAFFSGGKFAVTGETHGALTIWDLTTGKRLRRLDDVHRRSAYPRTIAVRPDGRVVAVGTSGGEILIFGP